jgi:hypothetical protein
MENSLASLYLAKLVARHLDTRGYPAIAIVAVPATAASRHGNRLIGLIVRGGVKTIRGGIATRVVTIGAPAGADGQSRDNISATAPSSRCEISTAAPL